MNHATLVILEIALATTFAGMLAGYLVFLLKRPKSFFRVWTKDGGEYSYRIKKMGGTFTWMDPKDKKKVVFPLDLAYARRDKRGGVRFIGNPETATLIKLKELPEGLTAEEVKGGGQLVKWLEQPDAWQYIPPKVPAAAMSDGRILQIAKATKPPAVWEQYILPGLVVVGLIAMATLFFVYKMYSSAQGHGG